MAVVNRIPFNTVPQKWAFDPEIGPFIRDLLTIIWQQRVRTGGDGDDVSVGAQDNSVLVMQASESANQALGEIGRLRRLVEMFDNGTPARIKHLEKEIALLAGRAVTRTNHPRLDYIDFNRYGVKSAVQGRMGWNATDDTVDIHHGNGVTLQVGLEEHAIFTNNTGSTITNGSAVGLQYSSGVTLANVVPYIADGTMPTLNIIGVTTEDVAVGARGRVTIRGLVRDIDTSAWAVGDVLYPSTTVAGALQNTKPTAPQSCIPVAIVLFSHATLGVISVRATVEQQESYGSFSDSTDQSLGATYTPGAVTFDTTNFSQGFSVASSSRITAANSGLYNFQIVAQITNSTGSAKGIWIWVRKNGTDITNTTVEITVQGSSTIVVPAWNYFLSMARNDYLELMWAVSDTGVTLNATAAQTGGTGAANFTRPAAPSAIINVSMVAQ